MFCLVVLRGIISGLLILFLWNYCHVCSCINLKLPQAIVEIQVDSPLPHLKHTSVLAGFPCSPEGPPCTLWGFIGPLPAIPRLLFRLASVRFSLDVVDCAIVFVWPSQGRLLRFDCLALAHHINGFA